MKYPHLKFTQDIYNLPKEPSISLVLGLIGRYLPQLRWEEGIQMRHTPGYLHFKTEQSLTQFQKAQIKIAHLASPNTDFLRLTSLERDDGKWAFWKMAANLQQEVVDFFDICRLEGAFPFAKLQVFYNQISKYLPITLEPTLKGVHLAVSQIPAPLSFLEDIIRYEIFLKPALIGQGDLWHKSRLCEECGKFFFYERNKARFCSDQCRLKNAYESRKAK